MRTTAITASRLPLSSRSRLAVRLPDFVTLMKPRVMSLAVFTALVGLTIAPGQLDPLVASVAVFAIAAGSGAAGVLNMRYEADIDAVMARTARRPIPRGKISRAEALAFGRVVAGSAVVVLALVVNIKAAALLALAIFFYVVVYTIWLKRQTPQNIVIGGAAGALAPVIGWAAATGEIGHLNSSGSDPVPPGVGEPSPQLKTADNVEAIEPYPMRMVRVRSSKAASPLAGIPLGRTAPAEAPASAGPAAPENAEASASPAVSPPARSGATTAEAAVSNTKKRPSAMHAGRHRDDEDENARWQNRRWPYWGERAYAEDRYWRGAYRNWVC